MNKFLILMVGILSLVSPVFSVDFVPKDIKLVYYYPYDDAPKKFILKYISPTKPLPQDSIYEEQHHLYNEKRNDNYDRYSIFFWDYKKRDTYIFATSMISTIYLNPHFSYNHFDKIPTEKGIFYLTEDLFKTGRVIIYTQGCNKPYDSEDGKSYLESESVIVTVFDYTTSVSSLNFIHNEKVNKNTTFKVNSGQDAHTYVRIDMYQDGNFVKNVYDWKSSSPFMAQSVAIKRQKLIEKKFNKNVYSLNGRILK